MSVHNTLCWYSGFNVSRILDYTVPCTACLCGFEYEVCQSVFSSHPAASRAVPSVQYVRMREMLWHRHIFYACKAFTESAGNRKLLLATCLGCQHGSDVWVLNESLQIRGSDGQPIPVDEQQYYWHPHYRYVYALCMAVAIA